jgi:hypothetical protein
MPPLDLALAAKQLEEAIEHAFQKQQAVALALQAELGRLKNLEDVVDLGIGFEKHEGRSTGRIGPVVFVGGKASSPRSAARHRIPEFLSVGRKRYRIDVIEIAAFHPACNTGIPDDQHKTFGSVPPGVAICAINQSGQIPPSGEGSSGAILQIVDPHVQRARYLLTCRHVVDQPNNWAQPWVASPVRGAWIVNSRAFDASVLEMTGYSLEICCLGVEQKSPIKPLLGMKVMKSGAATGITGSQVSFVSPDLTVYIDNEPGVPNAGPGQVFNFIAEGDSGSVAWLGTPKDPRDPTVDPFDLGKPIDEEIERIASGASTPDRKKEIREGLRKAFRGRAISLNVETSNKQGIVGGPGGLPSRWARGPAMLKVLEDLTAIRKAPVIIATN